MMIEIFIRNSKLKLLRHCLRVEYAASTFMKCHYRILTAFFQVTLAEIQSISTNASSIYVVDPRKRLLKLYRLFAFFTNCAPLMKSQESQIFRKKQNRLILVL